MKPKYLLILVVPILAIFLTTSRVNAQEPPHPPTVGHGQKGNQAPGGAAPIDGGVSVLLLLAAGYGTYSARKVSRENKKK
jgi:hypothetical protein